MTNSVDKDLEMGSGTRDFIQNPPHTQTCSMESRRTSDIPYMSRGDFAGGIPMVVAADGDSGMVRAGASRASGAGVGGQMRRRKRTRRRTRRRGRTTRKTRRTRRARTRTRTRTRTSKADTARTITLEQARVLSWQSFSFSHQADALVVVLSQRDSQIKKKLISLQSKSVG